MNVDYGLNNKTFIKDNCSIHNSSYIKDLLEVNGHRLIFLPPYVWHGKIKQANCTLSEEFVDFI